MGLIALGARIVIQVSEGGHLLVFLVAFDDSQLALRGLVDPHRRGLRQFADRVLVRLQVAATRCVLR
jgi:hypothetical protein